MTTSYPPLFCPNCGTELQVGYGRNTTPPSYFDYAWCDKDRLGIRLEPNYHDISKYEWIVANPAELEGRASK